MNTQTVGCSSIQKASRNNEPLLCTQCDFFLSNGLFLDIAKGRATEATGLWKQRRRRHRVPFSQSNCRTGFMTIRVSLASPWLRFKFGLGAACRLSEMDRLGRTLLHGRARIERTFRRTSPKSGHTKNVAWPINAGSAHSSSIDVGSPRANDSDLSLHASRRMQNSYGQSLNHVSPEGSMLEFEHKFVVRDIFIHHV